MHVPGELKPKRENITKGAAGGHSGGGESQDCAGVAERRVGTTRCNIGYTLSGPSGGRWG